MSADPNTPLFEIRDGDDIMYKDDPAVTQAKVNLMAAECMQQERAEQRRLEREDVLEPVKTLVLRYNTSVVNCVVKLRLVSVSNFYCNAGPNSCNNYSS